MRAWFALALGIALVACAKVDSPNPEVVIPADYMMSFKQVSDCGDSIDHGLIKVVVRVRPEHAERYGKGPYPMPEGTLVVKEQYRDSGCTDLAGYTAMRKEAAGYYPAGGDWQWFTLDVYGTVLKKGPVATCAGCHTTCPGSRDSPLHDAVVGRLVGRCTR